VNLDTSLEIATIALLVCTEATIITLSYLGWRTATELYQKLAPITGVVARLSPAQVEAAATRIEAWFKKDAETAKRFEKEGL